MSKQPKTSYCCDTDRKMYDYHYSLIMSKTPEERFIMGLDMAEAGRELMLAGIRNDKPGLSEKEYRVELLKRMILFDESLHWLKELLP
ncbi:MAG: hypothetical protein KA793_05530 [Bacteroidales bacterium]|nr:hypothetical protein [Bacteroidales bacterium]